MKNFLKVIAVSLVIVSMFCVSAFAATPQERIIEAIEASVPTELYKAHEIELDNLAKQVPVTDQEADAIIAIIEEVTATVELDSVNHLADLSESEREYVLAKMDEACTMVHVTYTITESTSPEIAGDAVINFYYEGQKIGDFDTHEVKKTGGEEYPAATVLAIGAGVLALAAVAFVCTKKFVLSK